MCKQANSLYVTITHANPYVASALAVAVNQLAEDYGYKALDGFDTSNLNREIKFKTSDMSLKTWDEVRTNGHRTTDRIVLNAETEWTQIVQWLENAVQNEVEVECELGGSVTVNRAEQTVVVDDFEWTFTKGDIQTILNELNG